MLALSRRQNGVLVSYVYMIGQIVVQLAFVPLLLRVIGQTEYGLYQLIGSVMAYVVSINGVLSAGVGRFYCMYKANKDEEKMENCLAIAKRLYVVISVLCVIVILALVLVVRFFYQAAFSAAQLNECSLMLLIMGANMIVVMFNTLSVCTITANERFVFLKISQLACLILQLPLVCVFARFFGNALMVCCVVFVTNSICALIQVVYEKRVLKIKSTYHGWDSSLAKSLLRFSTSIVLVTLADQIFWKCDQLIIGYFFGPNQVAVYSVGSQIYGAYMSVGIAVASVFLPRVSEIVHHNHDFKELSDLFINVGRISLLTCLAILGAFVVMGDDFILLWAGEGFHNAYMIAVVVMLPFTIDIIQNLGLTILQVINKYYFRGAMYLCIAIANIFLTLILVNVIGIVGAALSTALSMLIGNGLIMNWYYSKVGLDIRRFWSSMLRIVIAAFVAICIFCFIYSLRIDTTISFGQIFIYACIYLLLYFGFEWVIALNSGEKKLIRNLIKL